MAEFTHAPDPSSISLGTHIGWLMARFLRSKMWDVVCHLSELRAASKHLKLLALAGIGLMTVPDAAEAEQ
jgi:hypothetical protein